MTLGLAYRWHDKILMMFDSRETHVQSGEYRDTTLKIIPYEKQFVLGHSGASEIVNTGFTAKRLINHFINQNQTNDLISKLSGDTILKYIIKTWNSTLEKHGYSLQKYAAAFILCEWKDNLPAIYIGNTVGKCLSYDQVGGAIGDKPATSILNKYISPQLNEMTFEETINHFKSAFEEISNEVKTVGGPSNIYVLGKDPSETGWFEKIDIT